MAKRMMRGWRSQAGIRQHSTSTATPARVVDIPNVTLVLADDARHRSRRYAGPAQNDGGRSWRVCLRFRTKLQRLGQAQGSRTGRNKVRIRYAEIADPDGSIRVDNLRSARSTDTYILRGDPDGEEYEAHFTYHGFRYAELSGFPGVPTLDTIRGREVHTAVESIGNFSSSNALLNGMQHMFVWSIKTNLASVPTDCDQRDERLGWMGDAHLSAETAILNFDMAAFYTNFLRDIQDAQGSQGEVPNIVPYITRFNPNRVGDPAWGVAYPLIARVHVSELRRQTSL